MVAHKRGLLGLYAGFVSRAMALIIDIVLVSVTVILVNWIISLPLTFFTNINIQRCMLEPAVYSRLTATMCRLLGLSWTVVALLTAPLYFIFFFSSYGQTIGKYIMGVRVVRLDGEPMTVMKGAIRWVGYFVSIFTLGIGFLWVVVDDRRQTFHDHLAGTSVIYAWRARQNDFILDRLRRWYDKHPSLQSGSAQKVAANPHLDLITVAVPDHSRMHAVMNLLQNSVAQQDLEFINISVLVTDASGQLGVLGISELDSGSDDFSLLELKEELPPEQVAEIRADMPPESFVVAVLLHEDYGDELIKLVSRHIPALMRRYDMGLAPTVPTINRADAPLAQSSLAPLDAP